MKIFVSPLLLAVSAAAYSSPTLLITPLADTDGRIHKIDEWKGDLRIVNFWATWCAPCRYELPLLSATRAAWHGKGVEIIGVAVDNANDVRSYLDQVRTGYPMLVAEKDGQALMRASGNAQASLPYTILIGRDGEVLQRHRGLLDAKLLDQWLEQAATNQKGQQ